MVTAVFKAVRRKGRGLRRKRWLAVACAGSPIGMTRKVILTEGKGLKIESNNSTVVLNSKLNEVEINGGSMRAFSLFADVPGRACWKQRTAAARSRRSSRSP